MAPLSHKEIVGNWATLLLPVNDDDSIDHARLSDEIDFLISARVNGIYSNGTAGEFYNQSEDEFDDISNLLAGKCHAAAMPFQIGCCHTSPRGSLERIKRAVKLKPGAIQIILPDWTSPGISEILRFLSTMAEAASPIGLVLYNPPHAKKKLNPEEFQIIIEAGIPIVGCKVAGGDDEWYSSMRDRVQDISLFVAGHHLISGLQRGAKGAYSNVACLHPRAAQLWYEEGLANIEKALELERRIQHFMNTYMVPFIRQRGFSNQAVDKFLATIGGWSNIGTRLRWPYAAIDPAEADMIEPIAKALLPEFFPDQAVNSNSNDHQWISIK